MICYKTQLTNQSGCKNIDNQARSVRPKTMYSKVMLEAIEGNLVSSIWRVSGELGIWLSSVFYYLHNLDKSIWIFWIVPHILLQILQNFWLTLVNHLKIYIGQLLLMTLKKAWIHLFFPSIAMGK